MWAPRSALPQLFARLGMFVAVILRRLDSDLKKAIG